MAAEWWWFLVLNAIVAAVAVLSKVCPPSSPRSGSGITRRASSAMLQRLRSSIFSFPSAGLHTAPAPIPQPEPEPEPEPEPAAAVSQETEEPAEAAPSAKPAASTPRSLARAAPPPAPSAKVEEGEEKDDNPNAISMDEAYARIVAAAPKQPPVSERDEEASRSDVDAKAEEFIQGFKDDLRQQRLNSIFNYTQMLKKRAVGDGRRQPDAQPDEL